MRRWFHQNEDPDIDFRYLTDDQVERLAGELLERAYELTATDPRAMETGLAEPADLRIVLGARDAVGWRIRRDSHRSADVHAYGLIDALMPPDLRVPLDAR
jgi:hypothetical protein